MWAFPRQIVIRKIKDFFYFNVAPLIVACVYGLLSKTLKIDFYGDREALEQHIFGRRKCVFAHWHGDELAILGVFAYRGLVILSSLSRDGTMMARMMKLFGYTVYRGSSSRGGARGLIGLIKAVKSGAQTSLAVDGPRGPIYEVKPGIADLALRTGAPIVCGRVFCHPRWFFKKSWNKAYLPKPFSRVGIVVGSCIDTTQIEPDKDRKERIEAVCHAVKSKLDHLGAKTAAPPLTLPFEVI